MDTPKVSLPPIRHMLYNLTTDQAGKKELIHAPPSLACSHPPDKQPNYRPLKHIDGVYTFDSWHECLLAPPYTPECDTFCSCTMAQPEDNPRHRRAHSASTYPPRAPTPIPQLYQPPVVYRKRTRAHTTSGYLPSSAASLSPDTRHRYHCPHCRKTFSRPSSLRIHIYSHTGEKPHVCPYFNCGRRFSVQSNMRRHIRVHVGNNDDISYLDSFYSQQQGSRIHHPHLMLHGH
ncbi:hypothetical protein BC941DRAFT_423630 [Chlamydoabsidia padenii]|nr:hypothetical protein BC941DRAFT_423630 [Chlamydoabsidia padenii]